MGKGAKSLTNSLYKINDTIAQATSKASLPGVPEIPAQQTKQTGEKSVPVPKKELSPERKLEFSRMHHDLEIRVESMLSEYKEESAVLEQRRKELEMTSALVEKLKQELEEIKLPSEEETEPEKILSKRLRSLELMRLETIRLTKKMDAVKPLSGSTAEQNSNINLMDIPNGDILKKGFAFFFPLALALIFCTLLMAIAFVLAWKVAL